MEALSRKTTRVDASSKEVCAQREEKSGNCLPGSPRGGRLGRSERKKMQVERPVKGRKPGRCGIWGPTEIGLQEEGMTGVKMC